MKCHYRIGGATAHVVSLSGVAPFTIPPLAPDARFVRAVHVAPKHRGHGRGRRIMELIIADAQADGVPLAIRPEPYDDCPLTEGALATWYARLGFHYIGGWWDGTLMLQWKPSHGESDG